MLDLDDMAVCLMMICDPSSSKNPLAWFRLHQAGLTRELLKAQVDRGEWEGPPPRFQDAPAYDSGMWQFMISETATPEHS